MRSREYIEQKAATMSRTLDALTPSYGCLDVDGQENPIEACGDLPSESEVLRILGFLDDVFYPGYRSDWDRSAPIETLLIERLDEAYDLLHRQVRRSLPLRHRQKYATPVEPDHRCDPDVLSLEATRVVDAFYERLPHVRALLKKDVEAAYIGDPAAYSRSEIILSYPGIRAITTHRVAHELYRLDVPLIPRIMNERIHSRTGIDIHPGATIGESFFIDHGTGIVIGETTTIGDRVRIYHGVTLGAYSVKLDDQGQPLRTGKRHPTIEDDVIIYPGATILGGDTVVGRGAVVGSNVWLTKSVPEYSKIAYAPSVTLKNGQAAPPETLVAAS